MRDRFHRDVDGSLTEEGRTYMMQQVKVLNDDEPGVFRARPIYSFL